MSLKQAQRTLKKETEIYRKELLRRDKLRAEFLRVITNKEATIETKTDKV